MLNDSKYSFWQKQIATNNFKNFKIMFPRLFLLSLFIFLTRLSEPLGKQASSHGHNRTWNFKDKKIATNCHNNYTDKAKRLLPNEKILKKSNLDLSTIALCKHLCSLQRMICSFSEEEAIWLLWYAGESKGNKRWKKKRKKGSRFRLVYFMTTISAF